MTSELKLHIHDRVCREHRKLTYSNRPNSSTQRGPNSAETLSKDRQRYCKSVNAIVSTGQGQVTKGHYIQKWHRDMRYMFYDLFWPYNSMVTLVWSSEAIFSSFQGSSSHSPSRSSVGRASDSQPAPGSSPGSRRFGARYIESPEGDGLRSGQRPQPVEVSERGGPCPAMWAR